MKRTIAFIRPNRLSYVTLSVHKIEGLSGASVSDVRGFGRGRAKDVEAAGIEPAAFRSVQRGKFF